MRPRGQTPCRTDHKCSTGPANGEGSATLRPSARAAVTVSTRTRDSLVSGSDPETVGQMTCSARQVPIAQGGGRLCGNDLGVEEFLDGYGRERRPVNEQCSIPRASVLEVRVAGGGDDDEPTPAPRAARVLKHGVHQHVVEPDVDELGPLYRVERPPPEDTRRVGDLAVPRQPVRFRRLRLVP